MGEKTIRLKNLLQQSLFRTIFIGTDFLYFLYKYINNVCGDVVLLILFSLGV